MSAHRLVLASASPRRAEILETLGLEFEVRPSGVDESSLVAEDDAAFVRAVAVAKLTDVLESLDDPGAFVLAADTVVCIDGKRLGQPADDDDALRMLGLLAGRDHVVWTAIALGQVGRGFLECRDVETRVWFRDADLQELCRYVATGESRDKAGAYGVQGVASGFVKRLEGSYTNVVGLPAAEVVGLLLEHGALDQWP
ncbi:MAG: Maf family protein [Myxococcales bacterium]|nr:Maf family protein [Myxococcales bacterium]MDH3843163.1 Maf family protein [Myxococcales bacterium]